MFTGKEQSPSWWSIDPQIWYITVMVIALYYTPDAMKQYLLDS